eukprot:752260-Hanusia_phi.AAC.3
MARVRRTGPRPRHGPGIGLWTHPGEEPSGAQAAAVVQALNSQADHHMPRRLFLPTVEARSLCGKFPRHIINITFM